MREVTLKCDCKCGAETHSPRGSNWFILSQKKEKKDISTKAKLERKLYFCSLECLGKWSEKANKILPELQKYARSLSPRGVIRSTIEGLYV